MGLTIRRRREEAARGVSRFSGSALGIDVAVEALRDFSRRNRGGATVGTFRPRLPRGSSTGTLAEAVRRTFARRRTPIPMEAPIGLTRAYWGNPSRPSQVRAFARRAGLTLPENPGREFSELLGEFQLPLLRDLRRGRPAGSTRRSSLPSPGAPPGLRRRRAAR